MYRFLENFQGKVTDIQKFADFVPISKSDGTGSSIILIYQNNEIVLELEKGIYVYNIFDNIAFGYRESGYYNYNLLSKEKELSFTLNGTVFLPSRTILAVNSDGIYIDIIQNDTILWKIADEEIWYTSIIIKDSCFIYRSKWKNSNQVKVRDLYTGELLWEMDITKLQEQFPIKYPVIKGFAPPEPQQENLHLQLISHENLLIFSTSLARTFAFNIQSGELVWMKSNYGGELMIHGNHLIQFHPLTLKVVVVDIFTGELIEEISYIEEFRAISNKFGTHYMYRHIIHNDYICFVDNAWSIIFLNLHTKKIDWYTHYKSAGIRQYPVLQGNFMYILDDKNVLHIFEKTEEK